MPTRGDELHLNIFHPLIMWLAFLRMCVSDLLLCPETLEACGMSTGFRKQTKKIKLENRFKPKTIPNPFTSLLFISTLFVLFFFPPFIDCNLLLFILKVV